MELGANCHFFTSFFIIKTIFKSSLTVSQNIEPRNNRRKKLFHTIFDKFSSRQCDITRGNRFLRIFRSHTKKTLHCLQTIASSLCFIGRIEGHKTTNTKISSLLRRCHSIPKKKIAKLQTEWENVFVLARGFLERKKKSPTIIVRRYHRELMKHQQKCRKVKEEVEKASWGNKFTI